MSFLEDQQPRFDRWGEEIARPHALPGTSTAFRPRRAGHMRVSWVDVALVVAILAATAALVLHLTGIAL
jgi:hypothetical protein